MNTGRIRKLREGCSVAGRGNETTDAMVVLPPPTKPSQRRHRKPHWSTVTTATSLLLLCMVGRCSIDAFVVAPRIRARAHISPLQVASKTDFSSFTVKELKQLIKDGPQPLERGILSKLKRKQDLIEFLEQREGASNFQTSEPTPASPSAASVPEKLLVKKTQPTPLRMPKLDNHHDDMNGASEDESQPENNNKQYLSPKDKIFERVFARYPPLREQYLADQTTAAEAAAESEDDIDGEDSANNDIRQIYHPIFKDSQQINGCDMDIVFVGTASCTPGMTRGVSCTALRLNWRRRASFQNPTPQGGSNTDGFQGGTWVFDVGECTQLQVQRTTSVKPSKITKIFLTHAHGDHTFGLPGLLCLMGQDRDRSSNNVIDIYGPEGLRLWLRVAIRYSVSRIVPPYRVHELKDIPMAPEWEYNNRANRYVYRGLGLSKNLRNGQQQRSKTWGTQGLSGEDPNSWITQAERIKLDPSSQYGEVPGGRDIYPEYGHPLATNDAPVWEVEDEDDVRVYAAPMSHGIPCVGYVVEEATRPGRLRNELVQPMVKKNLQALKEAGFHIPMKAMAVIKNLPVGSAFTFPDGSIITQEEAVEPPRKGRKVVICGDTANCRSMEVLARDCDVLVHEATNAYLPGVDRDTSLRMVTRDAIIHGHSTPEIAGLFAKKINAKRLLMNHFSARYKGDPSVESMSIMMRIEQFAMKASELDENNVAAAWDLMVLPIPSSSSPAEEPSSSSTAEEKSCDCC